MCVSLVRNQAIQRVGQLVDGQDHAITSTGSAKAEDTFGELTRTSMFCWGNSLWVLKRTRGILEREVVLQVPTNLLVGTLGIAHDAFEMRLNLQVVINLSKWTIV